MISRDINYWMAGYWRVTSRDWWSAVENHELKSFEVCTGGRGGTPEDCVIHEMSHLINCEDADVFDPTWGVDEFLTSPDAQLSRYAYAKEAQVLMTAKLITMWFENQINNEDKRVWLDAGRQFSITRLGPLNMYELDLIAEQFYETCNIRVLWNELVRKYNIVSSKRQMAG